jgi:hypothetical protein
MAHNAGTLIRSSNDGNVATTRRRSDYPYFRTARKAVHQGDPEVTFLGNNLQIRDLSISLEIYKLLLIIPPVPLSA